jgi:SagB-type dehydrogenase family enzyme
MADRTVTASPPAPQPTAPQPTAPEHEAAHPARPVVHPLTAFERLLAGRRSVRHFTPEPLDEDEIARLFWAAQGVTDAEGHRTAPSAGARYPLEVHAVTPLGIFRYRPATGELLPTRNGDRRGTLAEAAWGSEAIAEAPVTFVIAAIYARTEARYGSVRGPRYVEMEAGHACQNVLIEAASLGFGAVPLGAFDDRRVQLVVGLPADERPLYLIAVGYPA